jgi:hypothetical protein
MNIFRLHNDPIVAATMAIDKHAIKMCLEQTQILHTSLRYYGLVESWLYKSFNPKHPSCKWAMQTRNNFRWVVQHGLGLCAEYSKRYQKIHKCRELILKASEYAHIIPDGDETPQLLAMPTQFQTNDAVHSYRLYYSGAKYKFATWKAPSSEPTWWHEYRDYVIKHNLEVTNDKNDGVLI